MEKYTKWMGKRGVSRFFSFEVGMGSRVLFGMMFGVELGPSRVFSPLSSG